MRAGLLVAALLVLALTAAASASEAARWTAVFRDAQNAQGGYASVVAARQAAEGLSLLKGSPSNKSGACSYLSKAAADANPASDLPTLFNAAAAAKLFGCPIKLSAAAAKEVQAQLASAATTATFHHALIALLDSDSPVAGKEELVAKIAAAIVENDMDSYGHAFAAFAPLVAAGAKDAVLARTFESVEDILAQAEETERLLFLSTGLSSTSFVIRSAFDLAAALNKAPPAKPAQITKLARYFENNVHASHIEDVHATLTALSTLSNNAFFVPLAITPVAIRASQQSPRVSVRVTKANGDAAGVPLTVKLVRSASKPVNVALTADASDASLYSFDLVELVSASGSGVYALEISASPAGTGKQSVLASTAKFSVSYVVAATISKATVAVVESVSAASSKAVDLKFPAAASSKFSVDFLQKIIVRFSLTDAKDQPFIAHQVFARVSNARNDVEHFVIGEHNAQTNQYQIVLDISAIAEALDAASDDYEISIIVGDAGLASAINWKIGTFAISFPDSFKATLLAARKPVSTVGGSRADFATKKEIHHIFRVPEKRPPIIVSTVFIGLVLAPAAFLLVAWGLIGANVKNMSFHPIAHVFHASIAGILLILVLFWLHLSFFTTLKYLALVGIVAAASGNHTLRRIAAAREKASQ